MRRRNNKLKVENTIVYDDPISLGFTIIAILAMSILGLLHINDVDSFGEAWGKFSLLLAGMCSIGFFGRMIVNNQFKITQFDITTGIYAALGAIVLMATQMIIQMSLSNQLSVSSTEKAIYYVFASVCEEVFYRGFILYLFMRFSNKNIIVLSFGVILQAIFFMALHQNYWDDWKMMLTVFLSGIILGIMFLWGKSLTINIGAHFIVNFIAVAQWLVIL